MIEIDEKVCEMLHHEFHKAEVRACKKLKRDGLTQIERAVSIVAYLSCMTLQGVEQGKEVI